MAGTIVERARRGSGLSQRELARCAGTSQPTLSTYEHGTKSPTVAVVERIVTLPQRLYWSGPSRPFRLRDRGDPARVYEIVLPTAIRCAWETILLLRRDRMIRSGLSEFQIELANLFFSLPESAGFLLAVRGRADDSVAGRDRKCVLPTRNGSSPSPVLSNTASGF